MERIPLFPLEVVLFPGSLLPLHIFEPRYKLMIRNCRERKTTFGVVLVQEGGVATVGCSAHIVEVVKEYPDGKLDILTIGRQVFQILEVFEEKEYAEADVSYLEDEPFVGQAPSRTLLKLFEDCYKLTFGRAPEDPALESTDSFAYYVADELPLDLAYKQSLLEMRNEEERRSNLESALESKVGELVTLARARRTAGGNGHHKM